MTDSIFADHLSRGDFEEIKNWVAPVEDKNLMKTGREELHHIGANIVQRFPEIFPRSMQDIETDLTVSNLDHSKYTCKYSMKKYSVVYRLIHFSL